MLAAVRPPADVVRGAYLVDNVQFALVPGFVIHTPNEFGAFFNQKSVPGMVDHHQNK
jgi:hypothetical protein